MGLRVAGGGASLTAASPEGPSAERGTGPTGSGQRRRPWIFALLFWSAVLASCWTHVVNLRLQAMDLGDVDPGAPESPGLLVLALASLAVVGCWRVLPWDGRVGARRKAAAPMFLAGASVFAVVTDMGWAQCLYLVAMGNAVFLFGLRRALAYAAGVLAVALGVIVIAWHPDVTPVRAAFQVSVLALAGAFVTGVSDAVVAAVRERDAKERVLEELRGAHAQLRASLGRVRELSAAEERARIAREIHDSVGHHLTVVNLQLQNAERFRRSRPEQAWVEVADARAATRNALAEVRRSVSALRPLPLATQDAAGAITALVRTLDAAGVSAGVSAALSVHGHARELPGPVELALYRAAQEGLTNAVKHSGAQRVDVELSFEAAAVTLVVSDDGRGAGQVQRVQGSEGGSGLAALRERVEALGGTCRAGDRRGGGFCLEVRLPDAGQGGRDVPEQVERWSG